jgi:hypothetical protein
LITPITLRQNGRRSATRGSQLYECTANGGSSRSGGSKRGESTPNEVRKNVEIGLLDLLPGRAWARVNTWHVRSQWKLT